MNIYFTSFYSESILFRRFIFFIFDNYVNYLRVYQSREGTKKKKISFSLVFLSFMNITILILLSLVPVSMISHKYPLQKHTLVY